jgi:hypothetical protein
MIAMTFFLQTKMTRESEIDGKTYMGALFYTVISILFNGITEISMMIVKCRVFYKQRDHLFYPSWVYALSTWLLKIPLGFLEAGVWVFMTYMSLVWIQTLEGNYNESRDWFSEVFSNLNIHIWK